ncbi:hypothetical protein NDU88_004767 [Pleurodeles waltl]|uniref:Uncharacterized protein n=1 Tax=Pleurodeles waltl TaxID=8319 RepID=A0AAV7W5X2_PLEWA|nr:hypothetical protein NDU88_004767 [Pleurodeles waltl]
MRPCRVRNGVHGGRPAMTAGAKPHARLLRSEHLSDATADARGTEFSLPLGSQDGVISCCRQAVGRLCFRGTRDRDSTTGPTVTSATPILTEDHP